MVYGMTVTVSNMIRISNPTPEVRQWCRRELILDNPDYQKKARMGFWTGDTPHELRLYEQDGTDLILPYGCLDDVIRIAKEDPNTHFKRNFNRLYGTHGVDYHAAVPLYDYQKKAVWYLQLKGRGILQSPAGSGKTQIALSLTCSLGRKALWITHTADLLRQSRDRALLYMDKDLVGTITEGKVDIGEGITFATVQTLCKLDLARYKDVWDVIIVDECHRVAGTPTTVTRFSKVLNALAAPYKYGLSATVHRSDGLIKATFALLGPIAYTVPEEAVREKIVPVMVYPVWTKRSSVIGCTNFDGTLNYTKLINSLCADPGRNGLIAFHLTEARGHSSLILSDRLEHLETLMSLLPRNMQAEAVMISGKMTTKKGKAEREDAIEGMRTGKYRYLFATYALAKEGLDIPRLERLYMATPIKDYAVVVQSIGRIARAFPGKEGAIAYDFVDDIGYLRKAYKERCRHYRKVGAMVCE